MRTAGAIPRGEGNQKAAVFTHFLTQKFTPLSTHYAACNLVPERAHSIAASLQLQSLCTAGWGWCSPETAERSFFRFSRTFYQVCAETQKVRKREYRDRRQDVAQEMEGTKQQPIWLPDLALLGCCLVSRLFVCEILSTGTVVEGRNVCPDSLQCSKRVLSLFIRLSGDILFLKHDSIFR